VERTLISAAPAAPGSSSALTVAMTKLDFMMVLPWLFGVAGSLADRRPAQQAMAPARRAPLGAGHGRDKAMVMTLLRLLKSNILRRISSIRSAILS
jgi:hypothetical protein